MGMVTINELGEFTTYDGLDRFTNKVDDPRRLDMRKPAPRREPSRPRPVRAVIRSDGVRYASAKDAGDAMAEEKGTKPGTAYSRIRHVCCNKRGRAYGYGWEYES